MDVYFTRGVNEAERLPGNNRDGIFLIIDVCQLDVRVDVVGEVLVSDLRRIHYGQSDY